jgi:hypothetical protein
VLAGEAEDALADDVARDLCTTDTSIGAESRL